jgi:hypothetical protein
MKRDRRNAIESCMREIKLAGLRCANLMCTRALSLPCSLMTSVATGVNTVKKRIRLKLYPFKN